MRFLSRTISSTACRLTRSRYLTQVRAFAWGSGEEKKDVNYYRAYRHFGMGISCNDYNICTLPYFFKPF